MKKNNLMTIQLTKNTNSPLAEAIEAIVKKERLEKENSTKPTEFKGLKKV